MIISSGLQDKINEKTQYIIEGKKSGLYSFEPAFQAAQNGESKINGKDVIMLTSNNYLGMATNQEVKDAMGKAINEYGSGTCGARLHNGTTALHVELEEKCAEFFHTEAAVILSAGYLANVAAISSIADKDTVIITDQYNHESIDDGIALSGAQVRIFQHNNMQKLEEILQKNQQFSKKLILVEGIYSMGGDICPVDKVVSLSKKYDASVLVDEAHAFGFVGKTNQGASELFGCQDQVHMRMVTFSKSLANVGGCIATDEKTATYIKHYANQYIFNASMPPAVVAGTLKSLEVIQREPWRKAKLWENTMRFRRGLMDLGLDTMSSTSPVVPIYIGDDETNMRVTKDLLNKGIYIATAIYPAVPQNASRLRATITASLTNEEIDRALVGIDKVTSHYDIPKHSFEGDQL
ncbi:aminotransferase class I/II-fold pyridoxal phosphate-dependent enzyme (plasmid) [Lactiplantibacillus plantarum]|uniref:aminotransferase class I/II-fold pyridoxal phosphate-dependent enzyme n=1 Tax=Lactiplantibacillus plantarum TaxID=1590 RepID=UPI00338E3519